MLIVNNIVWLLILLSHSQELISAAVPSDEYRLYQDLFRNYNKHVRPVKSHIEVTNVSLEIALFSILLLSTRDQTLFLNTEMIMEWHDHYLTWDPDLYNNTQIIRVPYEEIWYPDIILYNSADSNYRRSIVSTNAIITHTGKVRLPSHAMFLSSCDVDITWYPFDQQECKLYFSSWSFDSSKIELVRPVSDLSEFSANPEFFLENYFHEVTTHNDPCCDVPFSSVIYHLKLQRRTVHSIFFYILPGNIINACALLVFLLPPDSGEKIGLAMNCLVAMVVFLMSVTMNIPPSANIPLIGHFYLACVLTVGLNLLMSIFTLRCRFSRDFIVSGRVRTLLTILARITWVEIPKLLHEKWHTEENQAKSLFTKSSPSIEKRAYQTDEHYEARIASLLEEIYKAHREAQELRENADKTHDLEALFVCQVIDRIFFIAFLIATVGFNVGLLTSSPHTWSFDYCPTGYGNCSESWDSEGYLEMIEG